MQEQPGHLDHESTIDALETELARTVALAERTPADLDIPTCPGWTAADLWEHLGTVHRWVHEIVESRATAPIKRRDVEIRVPHNGLWAPWMAEGADQLLATLRDTSAEDPVWAWGSDPHARWWARRQLHETVVHDADAALALGEDFDTPAPVAADGICELLDNLPVRLTWPDAVVPEGHATLHLHATDSEDHLARPLGDAGEWMITVAEGTISYTHGHAKGDAAVRGAVSDLMLLVNRRRAVDSGEVEVLGDESAVTGVLDTLALI